jgi:hypothetical protein
LNNKLFTETYRTNYPNQFRVFSLPNSLNFQEDFLLTNPIARVFLKKWGETFYTFSPNTLTLMYDGRRSKKNINLPNLDKYDIGYSFLARTFPEYFSITDSLINKDDLIEVIYLGNNRVTKITSTIIANDMGKIYQVIDSTYNFAINCTKGLQPKLITLTGNENPYNTKVWRLGNETTTQLKETPSVFDLKIYPNPSQDEMNIELVGNNEGNNFVMKVYNALGQNVFTDKTTNARNWVLKKQQLGKGVFVVTINTGQKSVTKKVVFD